LQIGCYTLNSTVIKTYKLAKIAQELTCDNLFLPAPQALSLNSLWIYTMNRCTLALRGRALLCLDFITSVNAVEAA
jgi:hypothetical protein